MDNYAWMGLPSGRKAKTKKQLKGWNSQLATGSIDGLKTLNAVDALDKGLTCEVSLLSSLQKDLVTSLIPQLKGEKRDGSSASDPYVAFRRRTEKMQTRKVQFLHAWAFQLSKFDCHQDKRQYVSRLMPGISDSFVVISNWCLPWVWTTITLFFFIPESQEWRGFIWEDAQTPKRLE